MAVHVVINQKGGVGKSTITVNLAAVTADVLNHHDDPDASSPVAAVSVDPQGSAVWWASRINDLPFHIVQAHDDLAGLARLKHLPGIKHVYVDTPGWIDLDGANTADPLGRGPAADALRAVLNVADQVIIPIETEPLSFDPTARTINKVVKPLGLPYVVVINNWDPRDGTHDLNETKEFIRLNKWPRQTPSSATTSCTPAPAPTGRSSPNTPPTASPCKPAKTSTVSRSSSTSGQATDGAARKTHQPGRAGRRRRRELTRRTAARRRHTAQRAAFRTERQPAQPARGPR